MCLIILICQVITRTELDMWINTGNKTDGVNVILRQNCAEGIAATRRKALKTALLSAKNIFNAVFYNIISNNIF